MQLFSLVGTSCCAHRAMDIVFSPLLLITPGGKGNRVCGPIWGMNLPSVRWSAFARPCGPPKAKVRSSQCRFEGLTLIAIDVKLDAGFSPRGCVKLDSQWHIQVSVDGKVEDGPIPSDRRFSDSSTCSRTDTLAMILQLEESRLHTKQRPTSFLMSKKRRLTIEFRSGSCPSMANQSTRTDPRYQSQADAILVSFQTSRPHSATHVQGQCLRRLQHCPGSSIT